MRFTNLLNNLHWPHLLLLSLLTPAWLMGASIPAAALLASWLALNFAVLGVAEWLQPLRPEWHPRPNDLVRDGTVLAMNALLDGAVKTGLVALAAELANGPARPMDGVEAFVLGVLLAELGSYTLHRLSHEGGWLWRVHVMHHRPTQLNVANALTAHPINAVLDGTARLLPLLLLGFDRELITAIGMFHLTQALVSHANVRGHIGPLRWLVGSAALHRLHHSTREEEAGNFGTDVPFWDLLMGTYRHGPAPVAVGPFDARPYPTAEQWGRLLAWPFLLRFSCRRCTAPIT